ncbi:DNA translocase FtsK [Bacillus sp. 03113]|uniref:DNA translocase FtsK n=1 Tax=Bacillus sp. 03113 TaxID=2578211 RepID=UPI00114385B6|nr:DNA translocase FtsK [Bacillus sp. 03113]
MHWLKKIREFFIQDVEPLDEIEQENRQREDRFFYSQEKKEASERVRDIDARVVYQYPKGNFRFPLIPDELKSDDKQEKRFSRKKDFSSRTESANEFRDTSEQMRQQNDRRKQDNMTKKPFRPTEIPSPIYGFDQRPKNSVYIEHELSSFDDISNSGVFPMQEAEDFIDISLEISDNDQLIFEHESRDHGHGEKEGSLLSPFISQEDNLPAYPLVEDTEQNLLAVEPVEKSRDVEEGIKDHPLDQPYESSDRPEVNENEMAVNKEQPSNPVERKKSGLPFNVLMLSQDRRRLEQKRKQSEADQKRNDLREAQLEQTDLRERLDASENQVKSTEQKSKVEFETKDHSIEKWEQDQSDNSFENIESSNKKQIENSMDAQNSSLPYYVFPSRDLLVPPIQEIENDDWLCKQENLLNETLKNFNVRAKVVNVTQGPSVTRFEVQPEPGVKVNKITNLTDDIKLSLAARDIRMEAPIPGKHTIGIEVPNYNSRPVFLSEIIYSSEFINHSSPLTVALGLDIAGKPIVTDLRKMPHGLIAGATGSGKSVCINTMLVSLLYKANPDELKLLLIDPKMVELAPYNHIAHLVSPVITDVKAATAALKWAVEEMERRYELFVHAGVRDISRFNELAEKHKQFSDKLPYIVIIIDELADLMMMSPADVEEAICRIAQKARACGIHLIIATQRPSVDVITGLIKANVPTRIAFSVSSQIDSRTIIDISGAEKLLGKGDMLFLENGASKPTRLQGTFVSDAEIDDVVSHVRKEKKPEYLFEQEELIKKAQVNEDEDELFYEACEYIIDQNGASTSSLQRKFKIGYNRAARLIEMMEDQGFISEARGSKPREVLITESELESIQDTSTII